MFSFLKRKKNLQDNAEWQQPERSESFEELSAKAYEYLNEQQGMIEKKYQIASYESWYYDQEEGMLSFYEGEEEKITIEFESVGTLSKLSKTWLWSWANPHVIEKVSADIPIVRAHGQENNFEFLTKDKWYADEYDGWEMTAIAAYLMKAKGAYRVPTEKTFSYMIYKRIIDLR